MRGPISTIALVCWAATATADTKPADLAALAYAGDWKAIKAQGPETVPHLVELYGRSNDDQKASIAYVLYNLRWKSEEAKRALLADVHTKHSNLRLQVQWALGRVSDDPTVVDVLLENLQNDGNPLFRDKAACALAYDQIHLTPAQKLRLFEGLIRALDDPKDDVRRAAALALQIHTGQTKPVREWQRWLQEYQSQHSR